jgi:hypothetical protein
MSSTMWISTAMADPSNIGRPFDSFFEDGAEDIDNPAAADAGSRNNFGEPLPSNRFPREIYGDSGSEEKDYRLPHIFRAGYFYVVSAAAAAVLREFDLGGGRFTL